MALDYYMVRSFKKTLDILKWYLHVETVGQDGDDGDGVDEEDLDDSLPGAGPAADHGGLGHRLQPVQGYGS